MAKVQCTVEETMLENENGYEVEGIVATCDKCGHTTESFGTSQASIDRCLVMMRDECPRNESNFYVEN